MLAGLRTLIRSRSVWRVDALRHDAFRAELASVGEHHRSFLLHVLIEHDPILTAPQQPRERLTASEERLFAQIISIMLKEIEGIQKGDSGALDAAQFVKTGKPIGTDDDGLSIKGEALALDACAIVGSHAVQPFPRRE